ncbi:MAG: type II toxin-antitoxin system VapC family toxin [Deltaproteobacteria bacterium]|nr:type II toxin-antitoxin system VapC family toxin [Deltaproteobacteria bacterium]
MIVDSSALVAIVLREPGWERLVAKLAAEDTSAVGAPTLVETGLLLTAKMGKRAQGVLLRLLQEAGLSVIPFTEEHWRLAVETYARFDKGRHAAALNYGDCLTSAVARLAGQPLLFVGDDFTKTDLPAA